MAGHVDVHFHALPPAYKAAVKAHGGDPSGFPEPDWSPEAAVKSMEAVGASSGIISVSAPGVPITGAGEEGRKLARELNIYLGDLSTSTEPPFAGKFGFFGVLPDWQDVEGTCAEIDFLYSEQKLCSGVGVFTTYGDKFPGNEAFKPIWEKLQSYKALVFLHPTNVDFSPKFIAGFLPQPIVDFPIATTRAAVDLVMTGTVRSCPDVDIILSHAGGALPFIGARAIGFLTIPQIAAKSAVTYEEAVEDFARFYYDTALSTTAAQLNGLLDFIGDTSHILFGSDFPYAPPPSIMGVMKTYKDFWETNPRGEVLKPENLRANAIALLDKHSLSRT
ncbi:2-amino-3-carboxymuconate-6-semialdehyde decarboxylase [Cytospora mali]|uniref:6-methylsalicylate decarboxylase n=1 Tax=Cytospora mali TaxID=578113 RepID=A0A194VVF8_CYTMA|nr:2-amino-3-carboxymuconate-6-semialdehyde decarboxylase [Valsa mali]